MFVRNCWYVAGWNYELGAGELISRTIINQPIVLYRTADGGLVALEDRCCHRFAPLSHGRLEGDDLRCMYHGLRFSRAGVCVEIPGQHTIPARARVKAYPTVEKHSWIWVWMGDPEAADEALIPPAVGLDHPQWNLRSGQMDYEANYLLINDNLTDFTHLSYVHRNSFGTSEEFALTRPDILPLDRGIRVQRWLANAIRADVDNPLTNQRNLPPDNDQWQTYDYLAPGILLMYSAMFATGFGEQLGKRPPNADDGPPLSAHFTSQAVTPMTDRTSRYFFSWGPLAGEGSDELAEGMLSLANVAFAEDKQIIEAQQRVIDTTPAVKEVLTSADVGPMQMRSVINQLIKTEASSRGLQ